MPDAQLAPGQRNTLALFLSAVVLIGGWRVLALAGNGFNLSFDEAQYWLWSLSPDWGYYSKPPFVAWSIWLAEKACGDGEACVRLPSTFAYCVGSVFVYLTARRLFGPIQAFWSGLAFLTLPGVAYSSLLVTTDPPLLMFWAAALYAVARTLEAPRSNGWWAALGVIVGLGLLAKYAMIMLALSLALYLAAAKSHRQGIGWRQPLLAGLIALVCYLPNFYWNAANGFASYLHTKDNANLSGTLFHPEKTLEFLASQFAVFGPLLFAALLVLILRPAALKADQRLRMLAFLSLPVLFVMTAQSLLSRANANWSAPVYVAGSVLVVAWLAQTGRLWLVRLSVVLHVLLATLAYNYESLLPMLGVALDAKTDFAKRLKGWPEAGRQVAALLREHPAATPMSDDRKLMASLSYYARPAFLKAVKWNPGGRAHDTFDLNSSFREDMPGPFLFLTERQEIAEIAASFEKADRLGHIRVVIHPGYAIDMTAFLLDGFKGAR